MNISVAICTWNRTNLLKQTLDGLRRMRIPQGINWEIVLVDNNSTEDVPAVLRTFSDLPIKYLVEKQQGHSFARNCAVQNADGDLILWTDNDVLVGTQWLESYWQASQSHPEAQFFGSRITPTFLNEQPQWLIDCWEKCKPVFAARDLGEKPFQLEPEQFPYGANFAIRAGVQRDHLFDTNVGRKGSGLMGEDEITMLRAVVKAGGFGYWIPDAEVQHLIPPDRATEKYVFEYFVGRGNANILNDKRMTNSRFHAWKTAALNRLWYLLKRRFSENDVWVSHMICSAIARGEFQAWNRTVQS